ncbi:MAG: hypothetical protein AAGI70_03755, partial [Pseudomonadota bacterium]
DFSFTAEGDAIFGLGVGSLNGTFTTLLNGTEFTNLSDPSGGLTDISGFAELVAEGQDLGVGPEDDSLFLFIPSEFNIFDAIILEPDGTGFSNVIQVDGNWLPSSTAIPLPAAGWMLLGGLGLLAGLRRPARILRE